jgi:hypothetical protein
MKSLFYPIRAFALAVVFTLFLSTTALAQTCTKQVSNTIGCAKKPYVIWLKDKHGKAHHLKGDTTKYQWFEYGNGDVRFVAEDISAPGLDGTFDVDLLFSDRTETPPTNSPKYSSCFSVTSTVGWVYFETTSGSLESTHYGSMSLSRKGPSFQMGGGANITEDGFGASGWFNITGGNGYITTGDINVMLPEECDKPKDPECKRIVSNAFACGAKKHYVIWLKDKDGKGHHLLGDTTQYQWLEFDDGTAQFIANDISAPGLNGTFDIDLVFSGKTSVPPTNSPKGSNCFSIGDTSEWVYYPTTTGTISSTHYGTMFISRAGPSFQLGNNANVTTEGFGASGWLTVTGGSGHITKGDINIMLSPTCEGEPPVVECERIVSNATSCAFKKQYVIYLKDSSGGHHHLKGDSTKYKWVEYDNGDVRFTAEGISATSLTGTFDVDLLFSGRTIIPPTGSPKKSLCFNIGDTTGWVYFTTTNGTITSTNYGTLTITRKGEAVQMGNNANITTEGFGASGWLEIADANDYFVMGDMNIMLSQCIPPPRGECVRIVSNATSCAFKKQYVIYLKDSSGGHHHLKGDSANYQWIEYDNGDVRFIAEDIAATSLTGTFDVDLLFSGRTIIPPTGSPKKSLCFNIGDTTGWVYFTSTNGTITSTNYGTLTITRKGEAVQMGNNANITTEGFGASGWLEIADANDYFVMGDINVMLSVECVAPPPEPECVRVVTNAVSCAFKKPYVIYLKDKNGGHHHLKGDSTNYLWQEYPNGDARFTATGLAATSLTGTFDVDLLFSGRTMVPPPGSPKKSGCFDIGDTTGWYYYTSTNGTIISTDYGTLTITRKGEAFQLGNNANITTQGFGASGWLEVAGGNGFLVMGDINIMLSPLSECPDPVDTSTCKNTSITFCLDDLFDLDSINNGDVTIKSISDDTDNGYIVVDGNTSSGNDPGCCDDGKPDELTFSYSASNIIDNSQGNDKSSVTTYENPNGQQVIIYANGEKDKGDTSDLFYKWVVNVGDMLVMKKSVATWTSNLFFHIWKADGSKELQLVKFHTSCSAPIIPGDQFGTIVLESSGLKGNTCGKVSTDCEAEVTYFPDFDFSGIDTVDIEVCYYEGTTKKCQDVSLEIQVASESCLVNECPADYDLKTVELSSTSQTNVSVSYASNAVGEPDGEFAKLDNTSDELILCLPQWLVAGDTLSLDIASYDGSRVKALVQGSADGVHFGEVQEFSTTTRKPNASTKRMWFDNHVKYIKIRLKKGCNAKLMVDGLVYNASVCQPDLDIELDSFICKNTQLEICLDDWIDLDSLYGSNASLEAYSGNTDHGTVTVAGQSNDSDPGCCDAGKPTTLKFKYVSSNIIDNSQTNDKSSVTTYTEPSGQQVLIIANGEKDKNDTSDAVGRWVVNAGDIFTMTRGTEKWPSNTYFHIMKSDGSEVLQLVKFHTSCSAPIIPGDQFGTLILHSSALKGVVCGPTDECVNTITYFPDLGYTGSDTVTVEVCIEENGLKLCDQIEVVIEIKDSVCDPVCPDGYIPSRFTGTAVGIKKYKDVDDKYRALDVPDGKFAELDDDDSYIVLELQSTLLAGDSLWLVIASDDDDEAKGYVQGSSDGISFGDKTPISTEKEAPHTDTYVLQFYHDVNYIKISMDKHSDEDMLIDGLTYQGVTCEKELPDTVIIFTCVDEPYMWSLDDLLPPGSTPNDYNVDKEQEPDNGTWTLTDEYDLNGCDLAKPKKLKMRLTGGDCNASNHSQGWYAYCKDKKDIDNYSSVYIIVNDDKDEKDRLTDNDKFFNGTVTMGNEFVIDAALDGRTQLPSKIYVWIMEPSSKKVIQRLTIRTDCTKPLEIYDVFGSLTLTGYTAKGGAGSLSEPSELFKSTYTPNSGYVGMDTLVLEVCTEGEGGYCQNITYIFNISDSDPVAVNDTADKLDVVTGLSTTFIDILANDYHPHGHPITLDVNSISTPTLPGSSVVYDSVLGGVNYLITNPKKNDLDSFTYIINSTCGVDTAKVYIKFGTALPVEFISFTAQVFERNNVELQWITASELNNSHFEVERSFDQESFEVIGMPIQGAGTTTEIQYYEDFDYGVPNGVIYYRIKQTDYDGTVDYSPVRFVHITNKEHLLVYPNPVRDVVYVHYELGKGEVIEVVNMSGQVMDQARLSSTGDVRIDTENYPQGVYYIKVAGGSQPAIQKIVVHK